MFPPIDMTRVLLAVVFAFGIKELWNAKQYHRNGQKKWVIASLCVGIFACICAVLGLTGII